MELVDVPYYKDPADPNLIPLERDIILALKTVYDPEIPADIYELGLIYAVNIDESEGIIDVIMTLTSPGCPVAEQMPEWVCDAVEKVKGVESCSVTIDWDPPWRMDMMSMRAKIETNMI